MLIIVVNKFLKIDSNFKRYFYSFFYSIILLEVCGISKLNGSDEFKWDYKEPIGKVNPFVW
jgi:hypothetical protein